MSSPILVPSRGRANLLGTQGSVTHQFDDDELRASTYYFVEPMEYAEYLAKAKPLGIKVIPVSSTGMGNLRWQMALWAEENEHQDFFMFDDDLRWVRRIDDGTVKLTPSDAEDLKQMMHQAARVLYSMDSIACVGISAREGNNHAGVGSVDLMQLNTRLIRAFMFRTKPFLEMEHGRVQYMEDFDVLIQLLKHGWENRNLCFWAQDQRSTQAPGGCSLHRTHENHERAAMTLQQLHPNVVTLREKRNKTGGEFGTRKEVTIQWKRALRRL